MEVLAHIVTTPQGGAHPHILLPKMNSSPDGSDPASPMRQAYTAQSRTQSRMKQDSAGMRSSAVTPFMTARLGSLGTTNNATINETDNIKVAVRVRPLFPDKVDKDSVSVLQVTDDHNMVKVVVPGPAGNKMQRDFQFHACLGPDVSQSDVLHLCGVPQLLDAALSGYNVTIFAYGQTGSGKTYTMSGREEVIGLDEYKGDTHDGIITRSVSYLYQQIKERKDCKVQLSASYLEIYNEAVFDLLTSRASGAGPGGGGLVGGRPALQAKDLGIKWDPAQGFFVPGLKVMPCKTIEGMMEVIRLGMKHRHVGSHQLNMESSRSHSIMTIHCSAMSTDQAAWDYGTPRFGKICFVDLAGSERLKDSKSEGAMLKETTNINKSLFVLGKVISALAERDAAGVTTAHIPYRDSKLTKLLMDSLGGSALALMIACCSPSMNHVEETLSTLSYATRAKNIQNRPTVQYDPKEAQITALRREIELLRQENQYLREQIRIVGGGSMPATPNPASSMAASGPSEYIPLTSEGPPMAHGSHQLLTGRPEWPVLRGREPTATPLIPLPTSSSSSGYYQGGGGGGNNGAYPTHTSGGWGSQQDLADYGLLDAGQRQRLQLRASQGQPGQLSHQNSTNGAASLKQRLPSQQQQQQQLQQSDDLSMFAVGEDGAGGQGEDPGFALGHLRVGSGAGWRGGVHPGSNPSNHGGHGGGIDDQLAQRLKDTQGLLAKFSAENGRLAKENDRLRMNRALLGTEHAGVLDEIEALRSQLSGLESAVLAGNASPSAAKALLSTLRQGQASGSSHSPTASMPPSRDVPRTGTQSVFSSHANGLSMGLSGSQTPGGAHLLGPQASRFSPDQVPTQSSRHAYQLSGEWSRMSDELTEPQAMNAGRTSGPGTPQSSSRLSGTGGQDDSSNHNNGWGGGGHGSGASAALHIRSAADMPLAGLAAAGSGPQPPFDNVNRHNSFNRQPHGAAGAGPQQDGSLPAQQGSSGRRGGSGESGTATTLPGPAATRSVADLMVVSSPSSASASRNRQPSYGDATPSKGSKAAAEGSGASGSIIVANQAKLALLLGDGPAAAAAPAGGGGAWGQGIPVQLTSAGSRGPASGGKGLQPSIGRVA